jgi:hypothetical protein
VKKLVLIVALLGFQAAAFAEDGLPLPAAAKKKASTAKKAGEELEVSLVIDGNDLLRSVVVSPKGGVHALWTRKSGTDERFGTATDAELESVRRAVVAADLKTLAPFNAWGRGVHVNTTIKLAGVTTTFFGDRDALRPYAARLGPIEDAVCAIARRLQSEPVDLTRFTTISFTGAFDPIWGLEVSSDGGAQAYIRHPDPYRYWDEKYDRWYGTLTQAERDALQAALKTAPVGSYARDPSPVGAAKDAVHFLSVSAPGAYQALASLDRSGPTYEPVRPLVEVLTAIAKRLAPAGKLEPPSREFDASKLAGVSVTFAAQPWSAWVTTGSLVEVSTPQADSGRDMTWLGSTNATERDTLVALVKETPVDAWTPVPNPRRAAIGTEDQLLAWADVEGGRVAVRLDPKAPTYRPLVELITKVARRSAPPLQKKTDGLAATLTAR